MFICVAFKSHMKWTCQSPDYHNTNNQVSVLELLQSRDIHPENYPEPKYYKYFDSI